MAPRTLLQIYKGPNYFHTCSIINISDVHSQETTVSKHQLTDAHPFYTRLISQKHFLRKCRSLSWMSNHSLITLAKDLLLTHRFNVRPCCSWKVSVVTTPVNWHCSCLFLRYPVNLKRPLSLSFQSFHGSGVLILILTWNNQC